MTTTCNAEAGGIVLDHPSGILAGLQELLPQVWVVEQEEVLPI